LKTRRVRVTARWCPDRLRHSVTLSARLGIRWQHPSYVNSNWHRADHRSMKSANGSGAMRRERKRSESWSMLACHFLDISYNAARPPVKATLRLAALGLDGARPRCRGFPITRKWQPVVGGLSICLPLVGTGRSADYRSGVGEFCLTATGLLMEDTIPKPDGLGFQSTLRAPSVQLSSSICPTPVQVLSSICPASPGHWGSNGR
jgi:hypothetical protein